MRVPRASGWLILPAALGLLRPNALPASEPAWPALLRDVALQSGGVLTGTVVDAQGLPLHDVAVTVQQGEAVVARAVAGPAGQFRVESLRGGVYRVTAAGGQSVCRAWTGDGAPPGAGPQLLIVARQAAVRGQSRVGDFFRSDAFLVAAVVAGAIAIPIAIHNARRDKVSGS